MDGAFANDLVTRDGYVLVFPVTFQQLYRVFGKSWEVLPNEALFTTVGSGFTAPSGASAAIHANPVSYLAPFRPFDLADLTPDTRSTANAICTELRIHRRLLNACTLDIGVTGDASAAEIFRDMRVPTAVLSFGDSYGYIAVDKELLPSPISESSESCAVSSKGVGADRAWREGLGILFVALLLGCAVGRSARRGQFANTD